METTSQNTIKQTVEDIIKTADDYPGAVVIHNIQKLEIVYMSKKAMKGIGTNWKDIKNMSFEDYHNTYFNPEDAAVYLPKIQEMLKKNSLHEMVSFFQQVRTSITGDWEWHLTSMRVLTKDEAGLPLLTISFAIPIDPKHHVTEKAKRLLEENSFLRKHLDKFSSLAKREKEILKLIANGKSNHEVSEELFISEMTVKTHRKNIKRKLEIKTVYDLQEYARAFDLI